MRDARSLLRLTAFVLVAVLALTLAAPARAEADPLVIIGLASIVVLWPFTGHFSFIFMLFIVALEVVVHYHIDFFKMKYEKKANYSHLVYAPADPAKVVGRTITHLGYYYFMVIDQALHFLTYVAMGWVLVI